jgi:hypothetical protein
MRKMRHHQALSHLRPVPRHLRPLLQLMVVSTSATTLSSDTPPPWLQPRSNTAAQPSRPTVPKPLPYPEHRHSVIERIIVPDSDCQYTMHHYWASPYCPSVLHCPQLPPSPSTLTLSTITLLSCAPHPLPPTINDQYVESYANHWYQSLRRYTALNPMPTTVEPCLSRTKHYTKPVDPLQAKQITPVAPPPHYHTLNTSAYVYAYKRRGEPVNWFNLNDTTKHALQYN